MSRCIYICTYSETVHRIPIDENRVIKGNNKANCLPFAFILYPVAMLKGWLRFVMLHSETIDTDMLSVGGSRLRVYM